MKGVDRVRVEPKKKLENHLSAQKLGGKIFTKIDMAENIFCVNGGPLFEVSAEKL